MPKVMAAKTRLVPRSGWMKIKSVGSAIIPATGRRLFHVWKPDLSFAMSLARQMIMMIFANSEGCSVKGPIWIQRCAPSALVPANLTTRSRIALMP